MIYALTLLRLFYEFFKVGLFAVGGGLATIPFLEAMATNPDLGWFTTEDLTTMIAVSESTPGPIGVNMATYVGFEVGGIPGAVIATLGLITPSIIVILIISGFLQKFRQSKLVDSVFYGLRPASTALIAAAGLSVAQEVLALAIDIPARTFSISWPLVILAVAIFLLMKIKPLGKLHPIVFIGISALAGIIFKL
ncbi:MAG: chromate transporter [Ruminococcaceae bacterium]|nr:chromate transporter [Oscillospiraceae bacterium]